VAKKEKIRKKEKRNKPYACAEEES